jgi:signal peptide peptidase SppA
MAVTKGPWLIHQLSAEQYAPVIAALLNGERPTGYETSKEDHPAQSHPLLAFSPDAASGYTPGRLQSYADAPQGSIAVISISGPMMKEDNCGDPGTETIGNRIKQAEASPNIDGIILQMDTPGGTVDGTESLANIYSAVKKPKLTFVNGMMCSAGMWVGSGGDEIMASGETDVIGSIGTMISFADMQPIYEKMGMKFHNIYADGSGDKNKMFSEAKAGNYTPIKNELLNPTNEVFVNAIKKNRAGKLDPENEDVTTGKTYLSKKAKKSGLIDSIGNMDMAVRRVSKMARDKKAPNQNSDIMKVKFLSALTALVSFFSFKAAEGADHVEGEVSAEQWTALNTRLETVSTLEARVATLEAEAATAATDLSTSRLAAVQANEALVTMSAKKDKWKARAIEFGAKSGGDGKLVQKPKADELPGEQNSSAIIDMTAEHNVEAKKILGQ